ncbi:sulfotransferase family protein [Streptosporangiaceae bacterium NEAU-GS5]|nr:sulfotransferase family protein [Streptosporangiaceae bacterium NEAU-GS5]
MMRVIGAGYGRTGTLSTKTALERLGFGPCHHMLEVINTPGQLRPWLRAAKGEPDWDALLSGYNSTIDWPAAAYWKELADHYPDAKILLTVREPERWLASMRATIIAQRVRARSLSGRAARRLSALLGTDLAVFGQVTWLTIDKKVFGGHMGDEEHMLKAFDAHLEEVQAAIAAERLLVFDVRQGWEPLCSFLEVPVPDEPFPRVNDSEAFAERARKNAGRMIFRRS